MIILFDNFKYYSPIFTYLLIILLILRIQSTIYLFIFGIDLQKEDKDTKENQEEIKSMFYFLLI